MYMVRNPLTHDIYECRQVQDYARENKIVTQMGIQIHSSIQYRSAVHIVQTGVIGKIKEVHMEQQEMGGHEPKPDRKDPVPSSINWEHWIGPAPFTDYLKGYYHPGKLAQATRLRTGNIW